MCVGLQTFKSCLAAIDLVAVKFLKEKLLIENRYMDAEAFYKGALILCNYTIKISKNFLFEVYGIEPGYNSHSFIHHIGV